MVKLNSQVELHQNTEHKRPFQLEVQWDEYGNDALGNLVQRIDGVGCDTIDELFGHVRLLAAGHAHNNGRIERLIISFR